MSVSNALERVLQVRQLEEEQRRLALESALAEVHRLENALHAARTRERAGRRRFLENASAQDPAGRVAALVESEAGHHHAELLKRRIALSREKAAELREEYLSKRVERRQVETVIHDAEAIAALERGRREQQDQDERFATRFHLKNPQDGQPTPRRSRLKHEMKNSTESLAVPEAELRSNS